ncbi:hypothetical protein ES332_D08G241100v1 [Gossypium tomentosum]|uniref:Uncharacterized protein n=1 Tax=Gossypium tomentosum TaxID=34277 RepID=A0A5D2K1A9_GOSTO|nr:hypothetical protein ES332_D08G241100v1 [Gossypium tomentosum]
MSFFYKNFMFFLLVLTTAVTPLIFSSSYERGESHNIKSGELYKTWHVNVTNGMSNNKILFLHCKSAQNDLGIQNLIVGNYSTWKFRQFSEKHFFGVTWRLTTVTPHLMCIGRMRTFFTGAIGNFVIGLLKIMGFT